MLAASLMWLSLTIANTTAWAIYAICAFDLNGEAPLWWIVWGMAPMVPFAPALFAFPVYLGKIALQEWREAADANP